MRERLELFLFLAPPILIMFLLSIYPTLYGYWVSLHDVFLLKPESIPFIGADNYVWVLTHPQFWNALRFTAIFAIATVTATFFIGLGLALLLNEEFRGKNIARSILILPLVLTPVVVAFNFRFMYSETVGVIPYMLRLVGIETGAILGDPVTASIAVILVDVWQWTPFVLLILLSNLQMISKEYYESADLDGASSWQKFRHVTLPLIRRGIQIALIFRTLDAIRTFGAVWVMTEGGPGATTELMSLLGYRMTFRWFYVGKGTAFAIIMLVIGIIISTIYLRYLLREEE